MSVHVKEDTEYSILIADLIETLSKLDKYIVKFWIGGREIPLEFDENDRLEFLQEGIRARHIHFMKYTDTKISYIGYIFYDTIDNVVIKYED